MLSPFSELMRTFPFFQYAASQYINSVSVEFHGHLTNQPINPFRLAVNLTVFPNENQIHPSNT